MLKQVVRPAVGQWNIWSILSQCSALNVTMQKFGLDECRAWIARPGLNDASLFWILKWKKQNRPSEYQQSTKMAALSVKEIPWYDSNLKVSPPEDSSNTIIVHCTGTIHYQRYRLLHVRTYNSWILRTPLRTVSYFAIDSRRSCSHVIVDLWTLHTLAVTIDEMDNGGDSWSHPKLDNPEGSSASGVGVPLIVRLKQKLERCRSSSRAETLTCDQMDFIAKWSNSWGRRNCNTDTVVPISE